MLDFESIWELTAGCQEACTRVCQGGFIKLYSWRLTSQKKKLIGWLIGWLVQMNWMIISNNKNQKFMLSIFDDTDATYQRYWVMLQ